MKKILSGLVILLMAVPCFADTITLTDEQFENISAINKILKEKYPQFKGMGGSKESMEVYGLSRNVVQNEISKIDFTAIETEQYEVSQEIEKVKEKMVDTAIAEAGKDKPLKHADKVKSALFQKSEK